MGFDAQGGMKRRLVLPVLAASGWRLALPAWAQSAKRGPRRLAILLFDRPENWEFLIVELRQELAALGWIEGSNLTIDARYAGGDAQRVAALAVALSTSGADAILTRGTPATRALQRATQSVPVLTGVGDPVGAGFAQSLAQPGGNITGISYALAETSHKQLELLREMVPGMSRLVFVLGAERAAFVTEITGHAQAAANAAGMPTRTVVVADADALRKAFPPVEGRVAEAALVYGLAFEPLETAALFVRARLATMYEHRSFAQAGGLMSYRLNWQNQTHRTAAQIDKVLRGERPAGIPFEFPTISELVVNARTARALGLTVPQAMRIRADELIE